MILRKKDHLIALQRIYKLTKNLNFMIQILKYVIFGNKSKKIIIQIQLLSLRYNFRNLSKIIRPIELDFLCFYMLLFNRFLSLVIAIYLNKVNYNMSGKGKVLTLELVFNKTKSDNLHSIKNLNLWGNELEDLQLI